MHKKRIITFSEAINEALSQKMAKDKNVILLGLGVDDPKGIFGTTKNLKNKFFKRVFDVPTAENSLTGISIGLAIMGKKPIISHQRVEFSLLSLDQIINQAAKWFYMSGGKASLPIVIRLIIGRGWGQGPQHSQSLEVLFSHIPGLKVVCPSSPSDAKGLLISSIEDKNPVIFYEHRWLHFLKGEVSKNIYRKTIGKSEYLQKGRDLTIISFSYAIIECLKANEILKKNKIRADIIDLKTLRPLDYKKIILSAKKTKKVLIVDNGWTKYGIGSEISSLISENINVKIKVKRIGIQDSPIPSTISLAKFSYPNTINIITEVQKLIKKKIKFKNYRDKNLKPDQPDSSFLGPF
jgi:pyruvate/2-oxoglutarate/acetoin dehydrogenase E1 component